MIDINLFFFDYLEENEAEINVMIAEDSAKCKGLALESIQIMMDFAYKYYKKSKILAKIKTNNFASIKLFEKLNFKFIKE